MQLFRIHIRTGDAANHLFAFDYCLREQILGVGWQVELPSTKVVTWELYERLASQTFPGKRDGFSYVYKNVHPGDLIWTRDKGGKYYLAKVQSEWEYLDTEDGRNADITNVVRCEIKPVRLADDVPGKIVASFIRGPAIRRITDPTAVSFSQILWNQLAKSEYYPSQAQNGSNNLFSYLDWETTEDVIFIHLQIQGWLVLPRSRTKTTMSYEFLVIKRDPPQRAVVQVKTGNTPLNRGELQGLADKVFLFQANGIYHGPASPNVYCLMPDEIEKFIRNNLEIMPGVVQKWVKYLNDQGTR